MKNACDHQSSDEVFWFLVQFSKSILIVHKCINIWEPQRTDELLLWIFFCNCVTVLLLIGARAGNCHVFHSFFLKWLSCLCNLLGHFIPSIVEFLCWKCWVLYRYTQVRFDFNMKYFCVRLYGLFYKFRSCYYQLCL